MIRNVTSISSFFPRFVELAAKDRFAALEYLQTDLSDIIDHSNSDQTKEVANNFILNSLIIMVDCLLSIS